MNDMFDAEAFQAQYERLKCLEEERNQFIEKLLERNDQLRQSLQRAEMDLGRTKDECNFHFDRYQKAEEELKTLRQGIDRGFVSVLIDGDCMNFNDELIKLGDAGGRQAAHQLMSAVSTYLKSAHPGISPTVDVLVRVYANLQGLAKVYRDAGVVHDAAELEQFVRGFNIGHAMCDMVDAGNGKECADEKIKENFKLHLADVHCKHILFGGSADNGYARLLGPYSADATAATRITLLEGPPFASELRALLAAHAFASTCLPDLFRSSKIVVPRRVPSPLTPPVSPVAKGAQPGNYASAAALNNGNGCSGGGGGGGDALSLTTTTSNNSNSTSSNTKSSPTTSPTLLAYNAANQRVDAPLTYSANLFTALKAKKLCNPFHLLGTCHYTHCSHGHGGPLNPRELLALRQVARLAPCESGLECRDELCIAGHRCPFGAACRGAACRFSREMHGVDTVIVRRGRGW